MGETWAIGGVDLHVDVTSTRVRAGLEDALRDAVRAGRLPAGLRLPSSRQLAGDLGVARNTVAETYGQLVAEGWLTARQGSGTRVAHHQTAPPRASPRPDAKASIGYDLRAGVPTLTAFPATQWVTALRRALGSVPAGALGYGDPRGQYAFRVALAGYLARVRGVDAQPENVLVCSGFTQGLALLCGVLRARGARTVAVEAHSQPAHREVIAAHGLQLRPLVVDNFGAAPDQLGDADAVLLTPAHQFPLGPSLGSERRAAFTRWATDTGGLVIEDDYDGEFRYDRHPVGALQCLAPGQVAYLGTASKTLAPGVRLGWLVAPGRLIDDVVSAKTVSDGQTSTLDQLALTDLITTGTYDRHIRRSRLTYRRRRDQLQQVLGRQAPTAHVTGIAAGLHAVVSLPDGLDEATVIDSAALHGLALEGLSAYQLGDAGHPPALVVGYATPPDHAYAGALTQLVAALSEDPRPAVLNSGPLPA